MRPIFGVLLVFCHVSCRSIAGSSDDGNSQSSDGDLEIFISGSDSRERTDWSSETASGSHHTDYPPVASEIDSEHLEHTDIDVDSDSGADVDSATGGHVDSEDGAHSDSDTSLESDSAPGTESGLRDSDTERCNGEKVDILVVLDRSEIMNQDDLWIPMGLALGEVTAATEDIVNYGLFTFPYTEEDCSPGNVLIPIGERNAAAIADVVGGGRNDVRTAMGTPVAASLEIARKYLDSVDDGNDKCIILIIDSAPNCNTDLDPATCRCSLTSLGGYCQDWLCADDLNTYNGADRLRAAGYPMYVMGIGDSVEWGDLMENIAVAGGTGHHIPASSDQFADTLREIVSGIIPCEPTDPDTDPQVTCEYLCTSIEDCQGQNGQFRFGDRFYCGESAYCCELPTADTDSESDSDLSTDTGVQETCQYDCIDPFADEICPGTILTGPTNQCYDNQRCCDPNTPPPPCSMECLEFQECDIVTYVPNTECDTQQLLCCDPLEVPAIAEGPPE